MQYRQLGKWGIKVSEISLGTWTFGGWVDQSHAREQIHFALEKGINFFDCANSYALGKAEEILGEALSAVPRESVVIATKVYFPMGEGPNHQGLSRKHIFEQCHQSLRRLKVDYIDLYQCHRQDHTVPIYETVRAMDDLIRQGKILYWGVSEWWSEEIEEAVETAYSLNAMPPISNQPQYSMIFRRIQNGLMETCESLGVGQIVFSPLAQGVLSGRYKPGKALPSGSRGAANKDDFVLLGFDTLSEEVLSLIERLEGIAKSADITMPQLALAWCLRPANVASAIIGASSIAHIEDNVQASGLKLGDAIWRQVDELLNTVPTPD